ncbi:hypothetical protein ACJMK2_017784 [Sinanodonta woodiana]|uniref:BTB domain-containing protein n=1 Tax=Sinanodonta woodiana TaxID=1069815 RepID=A0ABD3UBR3_SINWO
MAEDGEDFEITTHNVVPCVHDDIQISDSPIESDIGFKKVLTSSFEEHNSECFSSIEETVNDLPIGWQSDKSLSKSLSVLFEKELWTDVTFTFRTDDHVWLDQIKGHKVMLAARSPVFQAMFFGLMDSKSEIEIVDASPESFRLFLNCLYTDNVDLDENSLSQVVKVAHKYQVNHLLDLCSEKLKTLISVENACEILALAVFYNLESLIEKACNFVDDHADKIIETQAFIDMPVQALKIILSGDTFYTKELKLLRKSLEWAENKCMLQDLEPEDTNKRHVLGDAFFHLRLPTMSLYEFTENVSKTKLITIEESVKIYQHMGCPSAQEEVCNSIKSRKPRSSIVLWPTDTRSMKFHCPDDVYLTGIQLTGLENLLVYKEPSLTFFSDDGDQPERQLRDVAIQGKFTVMEANETVTFNAPYLPKLPDFVSFEPNIFLAGWEEPYTLSIEINCTTSYNASYLERLRKLFATEDRPSHKRSLNVLRNGFPYCSGYSLIKGVRYTNMSNR